MPNPLTSDMADPAAAVSARNVAFISYTHTDHKHAKWLQRALEGYPLPRSTPHPIEGSTNRRLAPVFRDVSDLASSSDLTESIRAALRASRALIVLCSPAAAQSRWVDAEVRHFIEVHAGRGTLPRIYCVIVGGELDAAPATLVPPSLRTLPEGLAADLRPGRDGRRLTVQRLVAALLNVSLDQIVQRARARTRVRLSIAGIGIALVIAVVGAASWWARSEAARATAANERARSIIWFVMDDLEKRLREFDATGKLDPTSEQTLGYFATLDASTMDDETLVQYRRALRLNAELRLRQGDYRAALEVFREAADVARRLTLHRNTASAWFDRSVAETYVAMPYWELGDVASAARHTELALEYIDRSVALAPEKFAYQVERVVDLNNLGAAYTRLRRFDLAVQRLDLALASTRSLAQRQWPEEDVETELRNQEAESISWLGDIAQTRGRFQEAMRWHDEEVTLRKLELEHLRTPEEGSVLIEQRLGDAMRYKARSQFTMGDVASARATIDAWLEIYGRLHTSDPGNLFWRHRLHMAEIARAEASLCAGESPEIFARHLGEATTGLAQMLTEKPNQGPWLASLGNAETLRAIAAWWRGDNDEARRLLEAHRSAVDELLAPAVVEPEALTAWARAAALEALLAAPEDRVARARAARVAFVAKAHPDASIFDAAYAALLGDLADMKDAEAAWRRVAESGFADPIVRRMRDASVSKP